MGAGQTHRAVTFFQDGDRQAHVQSLNGTWYVGDLATGRPKEGLADDLLGFTFHFGDSQWQYRIEGAGRFPVPRALDITGGSRSGDQGFSSARTPLTAALWVGVKALNVVINIARAVDGMSHGVDSILFGLEYQNLRQQWLDSRDPLKKAWQGTFLNAWVPPKLAEVCGADTAPTQKAVVLVRPHSSIGQGEAEYAYFCIEKREPINSRTHRPFLKMWSWSRRSGEEKFTSEPDILVQR